MFKDLNSALKLKLLGGGVLLSLLLVYFLAIRDTLNIRSDCKVKKIKLTESKRLDEKIGALRNQIKTLDIQIGNQPDTTKKVIDLLLDYVTEYCSNSGCQIKEIPTSAKALSNGYEVETYFVTLSGPYNDLLNLVYILEQKKKTGGHIASLLFSVLKNNNTKKQELLLTLYVQHFKKV